jgi:hypothetical protein
MDRREFLQSLAAAAASVETLSATGNPEEASQAAAGTPPDTEGHTLICEFKLNAVTWRVYEDLRVRDGVLTFLSSAGAGRVLARPGAPKEIHVKLRVPRQNPIKTATVNGRPGTLGGPHKDTVIIRTGGERQFEVVGRS